MDRLAHKMLLDELPAPDLLLAHGAAEVLCDLCEPAAVAGEVGARPLKGLLHRGLAADGAGCNGGSSRGNTHTWSGRGPSQVIVIAMCVPWRGLAEDCECVHVRACVKA